MKNAQMAGNVVNGVSAESIDDLLEDLDLGIEPARGEEIETIVASEEVIEDVDTIVEEVVAADVSGDDDLSIDELEMGIERAQGYQEQDGGEQLAGNATETVASKKANAPKADSTVKTVKAPRASTPRQPRDVSAIAAEVFVLEGDASQMSADELESNKKAVIDAAPTQKKIAEKYENLFMSLSVGKQPSTYVVQAFKFLDQKKTLSSTDIVAMLKGSYKQGTAQSQAGQIMKLFEATKIATRTKNSLELNDNSVIAGKLRDILNNANKAAA
jgi:hypothetical protein